MFLLLQDLFEIHNTKYRQRNLLKDILPTLKEADEFDDDNPKKLKNGFGSAPLHLMGTAHTNKPSAPRASDADSIGKQFIDYYQSQRLRALIGIDDWADRLSYFYSTIILSLCVTIVTVKTYFLNPLACHCPTIPAGSKFSAFLRETCFTSGTIPVRPN
ncbi:Innexin inx2, partial [Cichlidogyrus casuarinus]